ncbi:hypothetical protein GXW71_12165 [Roseomonas hellenica]|uniref:Alginate lyase domain-containing protein n=1 Tax=Plastoroseomonas hellenica TaxID=2687306 RepID=A0ABS5EXT5_9PROT|nr:alginate lyase family protein [Plastoroseomonas hellenica]MBR0665110.1 hypothetical protein [Plastoroseomonas hellenica]
MNRLSEYVTAGMLMLSIGTSSAAMAEPLRSPFAPLPSPTRPASRCPEAPEPMLNIEGVAYYTDPAYSRVDPARLEADRAVQARLDALANVVQAAVERARSGEQGAAACAVRLLDAWAQARAMLGAVNLQGSYHRVWALAGAALAFLQVREVPGHDPVAAGRVATWMRDLARAIRPYYDRASQAAISDLRNNHAAWAGLAVAAAGIASDDRSHFYWGVGKLRAQLSQVTPAGALPQELARGGLALRYHLFALEPIAALERLARVNDVALPGAEQAALQRLTRFAFSAARDPSAIASLAGTPQDDSWLQGRPLLSTAVGLEIRAQAEPQPDLNAALQASRPYRSRWLGGLVTGNWSTR